MCVANFFIEKNIKRSSKNETNFVVRIHAEVEAALETFLIENLRSEILMQKPVLYGSLPFSIHRNSSGIPVNTHLLNFLKSGDTLVIDVENLIKGYAFRTDNIWDAIAFEEFAQNAFERFKIICTHAKAYQ